MSGKPGVRLADLTGHAFGRWLVLRPCEYDGNAGYRKWLCRCSCGTERDVSGRALRSGISTSCGCSRRTHGRSKTSEYGIWRNMRSRCRNPRDPKFSDYGSRGITVCVRWDDSFEAFLSDMGERPSPDLSIDRINNDGNYEPGNCRWATASEQINNTRRNKCLTVDGRTLTATQWAREVGLDPATVLGRVEQGWPATAAVKTPRRGRGRHGKKAS